jgi:16S rRNA processing protein RimM
MLLVVGEIVRPHGVRGEVVVNVRTDEPAERFTPGAVLVTDPGEAGPLTIESARPHLGRLIVAFEGVDDREEADALRRVLVCVDSDEIPAPDGRTALVPFVGAMVPEVDLAGGRMVMTLPEGLLDL